MLSVVVIMLQVFALLSVLCIMVAIISFCMETLPAFERPICLNTTVDGGLTYFMRPNYEDPFFIVETVVKFNKFIFASLMLL